MIDFSLDIRRNKKVLVNFILSILNNIYLKDALNSNEYIIIKYYKRINYNFTYFNNSISEEDFYN